MIFHLLIFKPLILFWYIQILPAFFQLILKLQNLILISARWRKANQYDNQNNRKNKTKDIISTFGLILTIIRHGLIIVNLSVELEISRKLKLSSLAALLIQRLRINWQWWILLLINKPLNIIFIQCFYEGPAIIFLFLHLIVNFNCDRSICFLKIIDNEDSWICSCQRYIDLIVVVKFWITGRLT